MNEQDAGKFTEIMVGLSENYSAELSRVGLKLRFEALRGYAIEQIEAAAVKLLRTRKFTTMPTVADFVEAIDGQAPSIEHKALSEANRIIAHLNIHGATTWPDLTDPITKRLMITRWIYPRWASQVLESELKWWAKEFVAAYQAEQITDPQLIPHQVKGLLAQIGNPGDMVPARKSCEGIEALN